MLYDITLPLPALWRAISALFLPEEASHHVRQRNLYSSHAFKKLVKFLVEVFDASGKSIRLTGKRLEHILKRPEMQDQLERVKETLKNPDIIKESNQDSSVWLFYHFYKTTPVTEKYLLVAVRLLDDNGFIITAFYTDRIKKGTTIWEK